MKGTSTTITNYGNPSRTYINRKMKKNKSNKSHCQVSNVKTAEQLNLNLKLNLESRQDEKTDSYNHLTSHNTNASQRPRPMIYTVNGKCRYLFTFLLLFWVGTLMAGNLVGRVVKVSDGDTFTMLVKTKEHRIRLYGVDAPEIKGSQPYSRKSKDYLASMIAGKVVMVYVKDKDRYGRHLGIVSTSKIMDINLQMIKAGMAWHYDYYDNTPAYKVAQKTAKRQRKGLWADPTPINPHDWRKRH